MEQSSLSILGVDELLSITRWQLDHGQLADALISVKHILQRDNKPLESLRLAAKIYAQLGLFDQAKKTFKSFLEQAPEALTETFQYGMVHYQSGDIEQSIEIWKNVLKQQPTHPPALFYSALGLANMNRTSEALRHLDVLIKSTPSDNLYFERARELIRSIEQNQPTVIEDSKFSEGRNLKEYSIDDGRTIN